MRLEKENHREHRGIRAPQRKDFLGGVNQKAEEDKKERIPPLLF
jgi:hypothetical protein